MYSLKITVSIIITVCLSYILLHSEVNKQTDIIINLIMDNNFTDAAELIEEQLNADKESALLPLEKAKLYYLLSLCYYYDEEDKVIEYLRIVSDKIDSIDQEEKKTMATFILEPRFSRFYDQVLNFARYQDYFQERKDLYADLFEYKVRIASKLENILIADRIKRELIRFENNILKESNTKVDEFYNSLDNVLNKMERIPSIRD